MQDHWLDANFARRWDEDNLRGNPNRLEQLNALVSVLTDGDRTGGMILDLGCGSGQLEEMIFARTQALRIVGVDSSPAMMELAHKRLRKFSGRYTAVLHDLTDLRSLLLPQKKYQYVVTVQTLHHLGNQQKREVFCFVHENLEKDGTFLLLDRIKIDTRRLYDSYHALWDLRERQTAAKSSIEFQQYVQTMETKGEQPASLEEHLSLLREAGFVSACLHLHLDRALIVARRFSP